MAKCNCNKRKADDCQLIASPSHLRQRIEVPSIWGCNLQHDSQLTIPSEQVVCCSPPMIMVQSTVVETDEIGACFASLPQELFCNIVAYLGATSSSLCVLSQLTQKHNILMSTIGDVMLHRARMCFRIPIPPKDPKESSVSLFVRHARASKAVNDRLVVLERAIQKVYLSVGDTTSLPYEDEKVVDGSIVSKTKVPFDIVIKRSDRFSDTSSYDYDQIVEPLEVRYALNIALCLLGCPVQTSYFVDPNEAHEIAQQAATSALEWRVTKLCAIIGALAYKFAKSRMRRQYEQEDEQFLAYLRRLMEEEEEDDDEEEDDEISVDASEINSDEDMTLLDKASLVLHHVVSRYKRDRVSYTSTSFVEQPFNRMST